MNLINYKIKIGRNKIMMDIDILKEHIKKIINMELKEDSIKIMIIIDFNNYTF